MISKYGGAVSRIKDFVLGRFLQCRATLKLYSPVLFRLKFRLDFCFQTHLRLNKDYQHEKLRTTFGNSSKPRKLQDV